MKIRLNILIFLCALLSVLVISSMGALLASNPIKSIPVAIIVLSLYAIALGIFFAHVVGTPLRNISATIEDITRGNLNVDLASTSDVTEISSLIDSFKRGLKTLKLAVLEVGPKDYESLVIQKEEAEHRLIEERNLAQKYFDLADGIILHVLDVNGTIKRTNKYSLEILGKKEDEIVGKNWFDTFVPKQDRERAKAAFKRLVAGEEKAIEHFENKILTARGERLINWHNALIRDEKGRVVGTLDAGEDITDQRRSQQELIKSENAFHRMCDAIPVLIWMTGSDEKRNYFNKAWLEFSGKKLNHELNDGWQQEIHPNDRDNVVRQFSEAFAEKKSFNSKYKLRRYDGTYRLMVDAASPIFLDDGTFIGYIGACNDITEKGSVEGDAFMKAFLAEGRKRKE